MGSEYFFFKNDMKLRSHKSKHGYSWTCNNYTHSYNKTKFKSVKNM